MLFIICEFSENGCEECFSFITRINKITITREPRNSTTFWKQRSRW